jgi:hypothetical protein
MSHLAGSATSTAICAYGPRNRPPHGPLAPYHSHDTLTCSTSRSQRIAVGQSPGAWVPCVSPWKLIAFLLSFSPSACTTSPPMPSDAAKGDLVAPDIQHPFHDAATGDDLTPLSQCTYHPDSVCWECPGCSPAAYSFVGCQAPQDCVLFCTACLASGYSACSYGNATEADPACLGWHAPKGNFSACEITGEFGGADLYCCSFCPSGVNAVTTAVDTNANCYQFCNSCIPDGFTYSPCIP